MEYITNVLCYITHSLHLLGITITPSTGYINEGGYVGEISRTVTFNCSSDLFPLRIGWYKDGTLLSHTNDSSGYATHMVDVISTDDHKAEYTCIAVNYLDSQKKNITINVEGKVEQGSPI